MNNRDSSITKVAEATSAPQKPCPARSVRAFAVHVGCLFLLQASQLGAQPYSIWDDTAVPGTASAADPGAVELGLRFRSQINGSITGIRFYKGPSNPGPHAGHLWTSGGVLLGSVAFASETPSGWQTQLLPAPVPIDSNTTYVVSYHAPSGGYAVDFGYFDSFAVDNYPLRALADQEDGRNGVYSYGPSGTFPLSTFLSANYWVDVVLEPEVSGCAGDTNPPTITAPPDMILECSDCDTDPSNTGTAVATDECSVTVTYCDQISGECPKVVTRKWTAEDEAGNTACAVQTITCLPASLVTDSSLCVFDRDPATPVQDFRLIFVQDPQNWPCHRIVASNPGQFFYNVFYTGIPGQEVTFNLTLPYPFVTQGANPIHAYDWVTVSSGCDRQCLTPGKGFLVSSQQVSLADYEEMVMGMPVLQPYTIIPVTLTVPDSGVVYLTLHLDYGLKKTSGYTPGLLGDALDCATDEVLVANHGNYEFSVGGDQDGSTSIQNENAFKKIPGVAGLVLDEKAGDPVPESLAVLADARGEVVGADVSDEDGFYMIEHKHTGKAAFYSVTIATPTGDVEAASLELKANRFVQVDFLVPAPPGP